MSTRFPIETSDGKAITEASDGFLWAIGHSVGFTKLPPVALAAAALLAPSYRYEDLVLVIKRLAKAARRDPQASLSALMSAVAGWRAPIEHAVRQPSELERHARNGCRKIRCSVCG